MLLARPPLRRILVLLVLLLPPPLSLPPLPALMVPFPNVILMILRSSTVDLPLVLVSLPFLLVIRLPRHLLRPLGQQLRLLLHPRCPPHLLRPYLRSLLRLLLLVPKPRINCPRKNSLRLINSPLLATLLHLPLSRNSHAILPPLALLWMPMLLLLTSSLIVMSMILSRSSVRLALPLVLQILAHLLPVHPLLTPFLMLLVLKLL
jgi:hypothetical protein